MGLTEQMRAVILERARSGASLEKLLQIYNEEFLDEVLAPGKNWDGEHWCQFDTKVLGLTFRTFREIDWQGLAGAEPGSLVCHADDREFILNPDGTEITEIRTTADGKDTYEVIWRLVQCNQEEWA